MSTIYNLEPPTNGKVVLKTTAGDIDIELWPKEAPKAVRNFVQLCLEGFYDGCVFHRVLKDFLVQTGDPTGTGTQSETVYGTPFKDEFHSRLRFSHRGIVACANEGQEHSNGSQFFITLGPTESLQKKHTIFGRVGGDTIYNVMEMNNLEVDANDRPEDPPYIKEVEVLGNPFDDIEPRTTRAERQAAVERAKAEAAAKAKPKVKKNVALLSFEDDEDGGDADGDGEGAAAAAAARIRSAHEAIDDERLVKVNTEEEKRLAAQEAAEAAARKAAVQARLAKLSKKQAAAADGSAAGSGAADDEEQGDDTEAGFERRMRAQALAKRQALGGGAAAAVPASREGKGGAASKDSDEDSDEDDGSDGGARQKDSERRRSAALAGGSKAAIIRPSRQANIEDADLLKPWELKRRQYKQRARLTGRREADTLTKMREFAAALAGGGGPGAEGDEQATREGSAGAGPSKAAEEEAYSGKVRKDIDHEALKPAAWRIDALQDEDDDDFKGGLDALRQHVLQFPKEAKLGAMDRDMNDDNLMVIDPLLEKGKEQWNRQQAKRQKRETEWGGGGRGGDTGGRGGGGGGRGGGGDRAGGADRGGRGGDRQRPDERQRW